MTDSMTKIKEFCDLLTKKTGVHIGEEHVHASKEGRYYYIQAPLEGSPMLLHHYRGPYFVDMHPQDLLKIESGEISPQEYIDKANWLVGYFWGGGSMIGGGYYQPMSIDNIASYLRVVSYRGLHKASGCNMSQKIWGEINSCPVEEFDPRVEFWNALAKHFEANFPGYILKGFSCSGNIKEGVVSLYPRKNWDKNDPNKILSVNVADSLIRDLLMRKIVPDNWDEYIKNFKLELSYSGFENTEVTSNILEDCFKKIDAPIPPKKRKKKFYILFFKERIKK